MVVPFGIARRRRRSHAASRRATVSNPGSLFSSPANPLSIEPRADEQHQRQPDLERRRASASARWCAFPAPAPRPPRSASCGSTGRPRHAGTAPHATPTTSASASAKRDHADVEREPSQLRHSRRRERADRANAAHREREPERRADHRDEQTLERAAGRIAAHRVAPSAARTAISRRRWTPRASNSAATFVAAMRSTMHTAPNSSSSGVRIDCTLSDCSGATRTFSPRSSGSAAMIPRTSRASRSAPTRPSRRPPSGRRAAGSCCAAASAICGVKRIGIQTSARRICPPCGTRKSAAGCRRSSSARRRSTASCRASPDRRRAWSARTRR